VKLKGREIGREKLNAERILNVKGTRTEKETHWFLKIYFFKVPGFSFPSLFYSFLLFPFFSTVSTLLQFPFFAYTLPLLNTLPLLPL